MIEFIYFFGYFTLVFELVFFHVPSVANTQNFFKKNTNYGNSQSLLLHNIYSWSVPKKILLLALPFVLINLYFILPFFYFLPSIHPAFFLLFDTNIWINCIGICCVLAGRIITFGSMIHIRRENKQVSNSFKLHTSGIFEFTRNPGLDGMFLFFIGYSLLFPSLFMIVGFILYFYYMRFRVEIEEEYLKQLFQEPYLEYLQKTKRFLFF